MGVVGLKRIVYAPVAVVLAVGLASSMSPGQAVRERTAAGLAGTPSATFSPAPEERGTLASVTDPSRPAVRVTAVGGGRGPLDANIAGVLLDAYRDAARGAPSSCHLTVSLLAAIGQVESGSLVGRPVDAQHRASILGPVLDGGDYAAVEDTDGGRWDGDRTWDRAVGPMQFIPSTWKTYGTDGDGDGVAHPQDVEDAAASTAAHLCADGRDLADPEELQAAVLAYNRSGSYARLVLTYQERYAELGLDRAPGTSVPLSTILAATPLPGPGPSTGSPSAEPRSTGDGPRVSAAGPLTRPTPGVRPTARPTTTPTTVPSAPSVRPSATPSPTSSAPSTPKPTPRPTSQPSPTGGPSPSASPTEPAPEPTPPACTPTASPSPTGTDGTEECPPCPSAESPAPSPTASPTTGPTTSPTAEPTDDPATPDVDESLPPCEPVDDPATAEPGVSPSASP